MTAAVESVSVRAIKYYPGNARRGDVAAIASSLEANGQYKPLLVQRSTGYVLAGNHTLRAARSLKWKAVDVLYLDVGDEEARRIVLIDNRSTDTATYDNAALLKLLRDAETDGGLLGTGYSDDDLTKLLEGAFDPTERVGVSGDTTPIKKPKKPRSRLGDIYELGEHRLAVGDCTEAELVARVQEGTVPDLIVTDPPYGVEYVGKTSEALTIQNDALGDAGTRALAADALRASAIKPGGGVYCCCPAGSLQLQFMLAMVDAGIPVRQGLVWRKDTMVLGRSDYHYVHEPVLYGWRDGAAHYWGSDRKQVSVLDFDRPKVSEEHPTMKPVPLFEYLILNSSRERETVYDPFGGSGTTMIACENVGRRAVLVELDPSYADVIVDRWQRHTGKKAKLRRD